VRTATFLVGFAGQMILGAVLLRVI
jgi:hypothetical protein